MTVAFDRGALYVLGKGSAFGTESAPGPGTPPFAVSPTLADFFVLSSGPTLLADGIGVVAGFAVAQEASTSGARSVTAAILARAMTGPRRG
jgi:hypothetical protein